MSIDFDKKLDNEKNDKREQDAKISRCFGLLERKALRKKDNKTILAFEVTKSEGPFYCPVCLSDAVVRKCTDKVDHFAHLARQSPIVKKNQTQIHNLCIDQLLEKLKFVYPDGKWEKERAIPASKDKGLKEIIPDISGRIGNIPVAIEVQASAYTIRRIYTKLEEYHKRNVAVLYIIPLYDELGDKPFRPRLFEKYLHSLNYGRVYYWTMKLENMLLPVHFSPTKRFIEPTTWYDTEEMEERTEGGFWLTYRTLKIPNIGILVDITKDFFKDDRPKYIPKNEKKAIPRSILFKDNQKDWWDKNEYKEIDNQFVVFNGCPKPDFLDKYNYFDEFDDIFFEE